MIKLAWLRCRIVGHDWQRARPTGFVYRRRWPPVFDSHDITYELDPVGPVRVCARCHESGGQPDYPVVGRRPM